VAVQPVPYRTDESSPTMQSLKSDEVDRVFPLSLEAFACTRFEMARFARAAADLGVNSLGICCGGGPHHVRAMAEELGRSVPASKYSPSMDLHPMFRDGITAKDAIFVEAWHG
jgi:betaine-homocysteine S-methyltransferase